jgi:hypothetical protein
VVVTAEFDALVYLTADCEGIGTGCLTGATESVGQPITVSATLEAGQTIYAIVDGLSGAASGDFTITATQK